jgi:hypothetical protein
MKPLVNVLAFFLVVGCIVFTFLCGFMLCRYQYHSLLQEQRSAMIYLSSQSGKLIAMNEQKFTACEKLYADLGLMNNFEMTTGKGGEEK